MNKKTYPLVALLVFVFCFSANAQDYIVKRDSLKIPCKVLEITDDDVSYKKLENLEGATYRIDRSKLAYVQFANGVKDYLGSTNTLTQPAQEADVFKNTLRFNFLSPTRGVLSAEYERHIRNFIAITGEVGYIGMNPSPESDIDYNGFLATAGVKIYNYGYRRPFKGSGENLRIGGYAMSKIHFETFEGTISENDFNYLSYYDFKNTNLGISFGGGATFHILKRLNIDIGTSLGYILVNNHQSQQESLFENSRLRDDSFSILMVERDSKFSMEFTLGVGFNF
jgi:hypothetical protein